MSSTIAYTMKKQLTEEQMKRMEENRLRALQLKQKSSNNINANTLPTTNNNNNSNNNNNLQNKTNEMVTTGKCVFLTDETESRFEVQVGYQKALIDLFKTIKSRKYDANTKRWSFSLDHHDELMMRVQRELGSSVRLEPLDRGSASKVKQAKFFLIDRNRFEVQADYDTDLLDAFKAMKTKTYDPYSKKWTFQLKEHDELVKKILSQCPRGSISISPLPKWVKEVFKEQIDGKLSPRIDSKYDLDHLKTKLDINLTTSLMPFQVEGICFGVQQQGRLLLADDMGLGKTVQGLALANYYKDEWPLFIVTPSSVKFMWKESAKRWLANSISELARLNDSTDVIDDYIQVIENGRQQIDKHSLIVIASYDLLAKNVDEIVKNNFNVIVCDECHLLKNSKAARTKAAVKLIQNCKRVILLSGTPALSRPAELYSQITALNPNLFASFHEFGLRYCDGKESRFGWDYSGYSNMTELRVLLEEKMLMRREKKDVIQQLPTKMREMIMLDPSLIETNTKSLKQASNKMENLKGMEKRGALLQYFQETSKVKAKAVCEYVNDMLESDKKFLVFAHHQFMLDEIEATCQKNKYDYIRIDGSTGSEKRKFFVDKFQTSEKCQCAILSITAASTGITLTEANLVVFAELFWNPGILVQAEDRVYRIGQKNSVLIQYLCAKGTSDDTLWPLVNQKLNVLSKAGLTKENLSEASTVDKKATIQNTLFKDLIEEELSNNPVDVESHSTDSKTSTLPVKQNPSPPQQAAKKNLTSQLSSDMKQMKIEQLLNFDLNQLDSPPQKKVKF